MEALKCKMCGGNLQVTEGQSYGTCDSCGTTMTIPKTVDERILNLFNRANDYRLNNEFDKALATYESILSEDNTNAEAHWGCVISKYGIEYVEDPATHKRIPTCHRVQSTSILADLEYKKALEYADDSSKELYTKEATEISEIQKRILAIANQEDAYDIFICYKETDEYGKRTMDSALAQDIYFQLKDEGYKVFFSRITLEDKLGQEYEPYIFAALNSAKVMLVIGTKPEYYNAVWVKNEWSRFLALAKNDRSKLIIPCYRDMDAYNLPEELSLFQSQDMGRIGFIQDLIRGIGKVIVKDQTVEEKATPPVEEKKPEQVRLMTIEDVFSITGRGTVITGAIENGTVSINDTVIVNNIPFVVTGIEQFRKIINTASAGMSVGILLRGATKDNCRAGDFVYKEGLVATSTTSPNAPKTPDDIARELLNAGYQDRKLEAIKILRERTGLGLKEAKDVVDRVFPPVTYSGGTQKSGGCYVATCVYGSYDCPEVWTLRRFRDFELSETWYGRLFIKTYYAISPTLVKWFGNTSWFKNLWKGTLDNMVAKLQEQGYEDTQYEDKEF